MLILIRDSLLALLDVQLLFCYCILQDFGAPERHLPVAQR